MMTLQYKICYTLYCIIRVYFSIIEKIANAIFVVMMKLILLIPWCEKRVVKIHGSARRAIRESMETTHDVKFNLKDGDIVWCTNSAYFMFFLCVITDCVLGLCILLDIPYIKVSYLRNGLWPSFAVVCVIFFLCIVLSYSPILPKIECFKLYFKRYDKFDLHQRRIIHVESLLTMILSVSIFALFFVFYVL